MNVHRCTSLNVHVFHDFFVLSAQRGPLATMSNINPGYNTRSAKKKSMGADSPLDMNDDENERMNDFIKTRSRAAAAAASSASDCNGGLDVDMDEGGSVGMKEEKIGSPIRESSAEGAGNRNSHARPSDVGEAVEPMTGSTQSGRGNPLHKLTVKLLHTYQEINEKYYAKHRPHCNDGFDDENGDYIIRTGEVINDRFEIANRPGGRSPLLGKGSFGQVVYAFDRTCDPPSEVALKIIRNHSHWAEQAKCEIELLRR